MSVFNQNNSQENSEELLYQAIKEELKTILEKWDKKCGETPFNPADHPIGYSPVYKTVWMDPDRTKLIKDTSRLVLQFVWRKLGLKIPEYARQVLDKDFNIMELKQDK